MSNKFQLKKKKVKHFFSESSFFYSAKIRKCKAQSKEEIRIKMVRDNPIFMFAM